MRTRPRTAAPAAASLLLLLLLFLAAAATTAEAADATPTTTTTTTPRGWRRWRGVGSGFRDWRRRRRAVALADAIIAGAARDAKESASSPNTNGGLSAAARAAAAAAIASGPPARTQAGCACLRRWPFGAVEYAQCANPNRDPLGYWCAVDQASCPGYYGALTTTLGDSVSSSPSSSSPATTRQQQQLLAFDYCVGTDASGEYWPGPRERTNGGCLCQSGRWTLALPGEDSALGGGALGAAVSAGKSGYHDRCAQPAGPGTPRQCVVDVRTCPNPQALVSSSSSSPEDDGGVVDSCPPLDDDAGGDADPETAAAAKEQREAERYFASVPPETHRTITGCACMSGGWRYTYPDGREGELLKGCHNPDGDPLGPWCAVDPRVCPWFAGEIRRGTTNATREQPGTVVAYDYCRLPNDAAERDPLAARLSRRAAALAEAAREEVARAADLLARQRRAVRAAIAARGAAWLDGAAASAEEAAAVLQREAAAVAALESGGKNDDADGPPNDTDPKAWALLPPSACRLEQLKPWDQCGGKSQCGDWACADTAWPGRCCPLRFVCERQHAFYWQCVSPLAADSFGGDAAEAGVVGASGDGEEGGDFAPNEPLCDPAARREREAAGSSAGDASSPPLPPILPSLAQCGGLADCPDSVRASPGACADRAWPGFCCPAGSVCRRQRGNPWYWQCLPQHEDGEGVVGAAGPAEGNVPQPFLDDGLRVPVSEPGPSLTPPPPLSPLAASGLVLEPESGAAVAPGSENLSPGRGFVVAMRLDGDYDRLLAAVDGSDASAAAVTAAASGGGGSNPADADATAAAAPPALRALKSGLVEVVTAAAAAPKGALYRVEVTGVQPGSILADVGVTFSAEADAAEVSAAYSRLRERAGPEYAASALPSKFGALEGLTISADNGGTLLPLARGGNVGAAGGDRASRLAAASAASSSSSSQLRAGPGVDADAAFGRRKTVGVLGPGAIAGVAIGCLAGLAAAGFAVQRGAAARAAAVASGAADKAAALSGGGGGGANGLGASGAGQQDKSAQLRYLAGEADEGELARELAAEGRLGPDEVEGGRELLREEQERRRRQQGGGSGGKSGGKAWVGAWLEALERRGGGGNGGNGNGSGRPLVAWPLRGPLGSASSPSSPQAAATAGASAAAFLPRGSSDGGGAAAADVAAYATAVPGGKAVSRRASKNNSGV